MDTTPNRSAPVWAEFRRSFRITSAPGVARLSVRAFKQGVVRLNGQPATPATRDETNWKAGWAVEAKAFLRAGDNEISVTVTNSFGPPALWLMLEGDGWLVKTDRDWKVSLLGAAWQSAALASETPRVRPGNCLFGRETMKQSLARAWPQLLLILLSGAAFVALLLSKRLPPRAVRRLIAPGPESESRAPLVVLIAIVVAWSALFCNNLWQLPGLLGFDRNGHLQYIHYILQNRALPLADEGWEMYQPPMYYLLSALALGPLGLGAASDSGVLVLRALSALTGLGQVACSFACLRLLFPKQPSRQIVGLLVAAWLPASICLSHHVTNEALAALFVTAATYFTLRILRSDEPSLRLHAALGLCLGLALLTKFSALLVIPAALAALAQKAMGRAARVSPGPPSLDSSAAEQKQSTACGPPPSLPEPSGVLWAGLKGIGIAVAGLLVICGWHYGRVWRHFGKPLVGNWDPALPLTWWQDPGYHTAAWYGRFGVALGSPLFSAMSGFADGLYTSWWGDGLCSGAARTSFRPPWNYDLMNGAYLLALLPTALLVVGFGVSLARFIRRPTPEFLLLGGVVVSFGAALVIMTLRVPSYAAVKAFYALPVLLPVSALVATGWGFVAGRRAVARAILGAGLIAWAATTYAAFWIRSSDSATHVMRGVNLAEEHRYAEAAETFKRALQLDTNSLAGRVGLAEALSRLGRRPEALEQAAEARRQHPNEGEPLLQMSVALSLDGHYEESAVYMRQALECEPDHPTAYQTLAMCQARLGQYQQVIETCREGLRASPFDPELHHSLANALGRTGDLTNAAAQLRMALAFKPDWPQAQALLGFTLFSLGKLGEAAIECEKATQLNPRDPSLRCLLARTLAAVGNPRGAAEQYQQALTLQPDLIEALNNLALLRSSNANAGLRDGVEAVRLARRACELTQDREPVLLGTLAAAYAEAGRFSEAVSTAEKARQLAAAAGQTDLAERNRELLERYRAGKAYHEAEKRP